MHRAPHLLWPDGQPATVFDMERAQSVRADHTVKPGTIGTVPRTAPMKGHQLAGNKTDAEKSLRAVQWLPSEGQTAGAVHLRSTLVLLAQHCVARLMHSPTHTLAWLAR